MDKVSAIPAAEALDAAAEDFLQNIAPDLADLVADCDPVSFRSLAILQWIDDLQDDQAGATSADSLGHALRALESVIDARVREAASPLAATEIGRLNRALRPNRDASGTMLCFAALAHVHLITQLAHPKTADQIAGGARSFHRDEIDRIAAILADRLRT